MIPHRYISFGISSILVVNYILNKTQKLSAAGLPVRNLLWVAHAETGGGEVFLTRFDNYMNGNARYRVRQSGWASAPEAIGVEARNIQLMADVIAASRTAAAANKKATKQLDTVSELCRFRKWARNRGACGFTLTGKEGGVGEGGGEGLCGLERGGGEWRGGEWWGGERWGGGVVERGGKGRETRGGCRPCFTP